ncbi:MAG: hypothetical protein AAFW00_16965 [Bacteroidota bacterium]
MRQGKKQRNTQYSCRRQKRKSFFGLFFSALILMWLWNWLVPDLFNGPAIGYLQALVMMVIARLISGRPRGERKMKREMKCKGKWRGHFEAKMKERETQEEAHEETTGDKGKSDQEYKEGFTTGKWEVNIVDVSNQSEEEEESKEEEPDEPTDDSDDKGESPS